MTLVERKRNDTRPLDGTLLRNGKVLPLTGAQVRWKMVPAPGSAGQPVDATVELIDAAAGKVRWSPTPEEVAVAGVYRGEFEVKFGQGLTVTFPDDGWIDLVLLADAEAAPAPGQFFDSVTAVVAP